MRAATGILFGCCLVFAQPNPLQVPAPYRPEVVFSVTSTLVQIDAVVTDSKGHHIADLVPSDFEISVDGKTQKITHFSYVRVTAPAGPSSAQAEPAARSRGSRRQKLPPPPAAALRREDVRRTIVLMVDDLGLSFESMAYVRQAIRKFIETQMQPGDLVAICRTGAGSGALQQFTNDPRLLLSIAEGLRWIPGGRFGTGVFEPIGAYGRFGGAGNPSGDLAVRDPVYQIERNVQFTVGTLGAVNYIVGALRELPGRKSIVLFSDGFGLTPTNAYPVLHTGGEGSSIGSSNLEIIEALRRLIDRANRSGTVIYTMHAAGLQTLQPDAQDNPHLGGLPHVRDDEKQQILRGLTDVGVLGGRDVQFNILQEGLAYLAYETGGLPYENGNDMNWGLARVLEDQAGYYLLGYKPSESTFQAKHGERPYHSIRVRVRRPGLRVRTRTGFFGETDDETKPRYSTVEQMRAAMLSPFRSSDVRLRLTALYSEKPEQGAAVRNLIHIDPRDLRFELRPDGSAAAYVDIIAVATGAGDAPLESMAASYEFQVAPDRVREVLSDGALYVLDVPIKKRGPYQIRTAVRDRATGKVGSASQFLVVPDLKKQKFALTSVVLQDGDRAPGTSGLLGMVPARRQFHPGGRVQYMCLVKNAVSTLDARVRIFRDQKELLDASAAIVEVPGGGHAVTGVLRLADTIKPGEYYLQVSAAESGPRKPFADGQWTDFEVVP